MALDRGATKSSGRGCSLLLSCAFALLFACSPVKRAHHTGAEPSHEADAGSLPVDAGAMVEAAHLDAAADAGKHAPCFGCLVDGVCFAEGALNPSDECLVCRALSNDHDFSVRTGGSCGEARDCHQAGVCSARGECQAPLAPVGTSCGAGTEACARAACDAQGSCVTHLFAKGTSCGDRSECHGLGACDGEGTCTPGPTLALGEECVDHGHCVGSVAAPTCECVPGFALKDGSCVDVDECALGTSTCDAMPNACINDAGSFHCGCPEGFTGNGYGKQGCACARDDYSPLCQPWSTVAVAPASSCGISAGALFCWGRNAEGQLGLGDKTGRATVTQVGSANDWDSVSVAVDYTCATRGGDLYCWGSNIGLGFGVLTPAESTTPVRVSDFHDWVSVSAASDTVNQLTCGLRGQGDLYCWGKLASHEIVGPHLLEPHGGFDSVDVGEGGRACALRSGELYCWGINLACNDEQGQVVLCPQPTRITGFSDFSQLSVSYDYIGAIRQGQIYTWPRGPSEAPVILDDFSDFVDLSLRRSELCAVRSNGHAYCWGGTVTAPGALKGSLDAPGVDLGPGFSKVHASFGVACGLRDGGLQCWGDSLAAGLSMVPVEVQGTDFDFVAAGGDRTCALRGAGELYCWGRNSAATPSWQPGRIGMDSDWLQVAVAQGHFCGIRAPGDLYCWGENASAQLGILGSTLPQALPTRIGTDHDWTQIAVNGGISCGLRGEQGALYCWGSGTAKAALIVPEGVTEISVGASEICLLRDGVAYCGVYGPSDPPDAVAGAHSFTTLRTHGDYRCGVSSTGVLACWGTNINGRLGTGSNDDESEPTPTPLQMSWQKVSVGLSHGCGLASTGSLWCWGDNSRGQLGRADIAKALEPHLVDEARYQQLVSGDNHSCALRSGRLRCWGANGYGQLGTDRGFLPHPPASPNDVW